MPSDRFEGTVTLFRAVSRAEAAEVLTEGMFRARLNTLAGKWLAETAEDAAHWGDLLQGPGNFEILEVELPKSDAENLLRLERLDNIGPARYAELDQLNVPGLKVIRLGK